MTSNIAKNCPECGELLTIRRNRQTRQQFLGCVGWPACEYTEEMPEDVRLRLAGAPTLPGFGAPEKPDMGG